MNLFKNDIKYYIYNQLIRCKAYIMFVEKGKTYKIFLDSYEEGLFSTCSCAFYIDTATCEHIAMVAL